MLFCSVIALIFINGCAGTLQLGTIQRPPETAKLRLAIIPISGYHKAGGFSGSHEFFKTVQYQQTARHLEQLSYYEVVPEKDISSVLGEYDADLWDLTRKSAELSRRIGETLFADYMLLIERSVMNADYTLNYTLVNTRTGKQFNVRFDRNIPKGGTNKFNEATEYAYARIFSEAKGDLLSTAIIKGRNTASRKELEDSKTALGRQPSVQRAAEEKALSASNSAIMAEAENKRAAVLRKAEEERLSAEAKARELAERTRLAAEKVSREKVETERLASEKAALEKPPSQKVTTHITDPSNRAKEAETTQNQSRLIVYDINAAEQLRTVALILSEAIREEVFKRGAYELVNRENLKQIMEEMTFQQSGMVNDAQAVKIGQGMAAQEIVLGQLSPIGSSLVLQSKRVDMGSMGNLSFASIRCEAGKEEFMLDRIKELIDNLFVKKDRRKSGI